jgi:hypothetical protein
MLDQAQNKRYSVDPIKRQLKRPIGFVIGHQQYMVGICPLLYPFY